MAMNVPKMPNDLNHFRLNTISQSANGILTKTDEAKTFLLE